MLVVLLKHLMGLGVIGREDVDVDAQGFGDRPEGAEPEGEADVLARTGLWGFDGKGDQLHLAAEPLLQAEAAGAIAERLAADPRPAREGDPVQGDAGEQEQDGDRGGPSGWEPETRHRGNRPAEAPQPEGQ